MATHERGVPSSGFRLSAVWLACVVALNPAAAIAQTSEPPDDDVAAVREFLIRDRRTGRDFVRPPAFSRALLAPALAADPDAMDDHVRHITVAGVAEELHTQIAATGELVGGERLTLSKVVARAERLLRDRHYTNGVVTIAQFSRDADNPELIRVSIEQPALGGVEIVGAPANIQPYLEKLGDRLQDEGPLTEERLERYLILFNRVPGCRTRLDMKAASRAGEGAKIMLRVSYDRISTQMKISSRAPRGIGREVIFNKIIVNDVLAGADYVDFRVRNNIAPGRALIFDATYGVNLHPDGLLLEFSAFSSSIRPDRARTGGNQYDIGMQFYGATLTRPLRLREHSQTYLLLSASSGNAQFSVDGPALFDDTRWLGSAAIEWTQHSAGGVSFATASVNQGFAILGATARGDPLASRKGEGAGFAYFAFEASRDQKLTSWAEIAANVYMQASTHALLAPDQCVYGGGDYGRAFEIDVLFGDTCFLASAELRLSPKALNFGRASVRPYVYADGGAMRQVGIPDPTQPARVARMSAGGGFRMSLGKTLSAQIEFTQALRRETPTGANQERSFYFEIAKDF